MRINLGIISNPKNRDCTKCQNVLLDGYSGSSNAIWYNQRCRSASIDEMDQEPQHCQYVKLCSFIPKVKPINYVKEKVNKLRIIFKILLKYWLTIIIVITLLFISFKIISGCKSSSQNIWKIETKLHKN